MSLYKVHGILQAIAFLFLFPLGVVVAIFRQYLGSWWLKAHLILQFLATLCVVIAIIAIVLAHQKHESKDKDEKSHDNESTEKRAHKIIGPILVTILLLQWIWAILVRGKVDWDVWYKVHLLLAGLIVTLGFVQVYLGVRMSKK